MKGFADKKLVMIVLGAAFAAVLIATIISIHENAMIDAMSSALVNE